MGAPYDTIQPHGPTKPASVMVVSTFLPILALIAVVLRFNVRRVQRTALRFDDWIMIPAALLVIGMSICGILGVQKKIWGYHSPTDSAAILVDSVTYEGKATVSDKHIGLAASITRAAYIIQMFDTQFDPNADYRLQDTLIIFWSNFEASMCLLAVNLPSLWAYKTSIPPTQFLASVRSFITIRSDRSTTRNRAGHDTITPDNRSENSSSSVAKMCTSNNRVDVYAMHDLESQNQHIAAPKGAILVDSHMLLTTQNKSVRGQE
ncbi:hypothetical protein EAF04_009123 [Stromatinia cepivora]|nr:hypothetical protein EAF04_009123 [Stromatinia cepivora]